MATRETLWDVVSSMATVWKFPGEDLKATAKAYHLALRDLSDDQIMDAAQALLSSWTKTVPPKPADIRTTAAELKPSPYTPPRLARPEPSHEDIMHKLRCDTYHVRAVTEVLGEKRRHEHHRYWTAEEWKAISAKQAKYRAELGL